MDSCKAGQDLPTPGLQKVSKLARPLSPAWLFLDEAQSLPHHQAQADISAEACQDNHCLPGLGFQQSGSSLHIVNNLPILPNPAVYKRSRSSHQLHAEGLLSP